MALDVRTRGVALQLSCSDLGFKDFAPADPPIQALATPQDDLDLQPVQPDGARYCANAPLCPSSIRPTLNQSKQVY